MFLIEGVHCGKLNEISADPARLAPRVSLKMLPLFFLRILIFFLVPCKQGTSGGEAGHRLLFFLSFSCGKYTRTLRQGVLLLRSNLTSPNVYSTRFFSSVIAEAMTF